jgi:uncharacterized membrane protein YgcG
VETVLGVSMAPKTVRMVLVEGENADGVTVDEDNIDVPHADGEAAPSGPDQVISAILGTREGAAESGYELLSTGVTWTDPVEASALRDALAKHKVENVMLVSSFLAAAALAQQAGSATGYDKTALLFVEPDTATLAVVDSADGSISEVQRQVLQGGDRTAELATLAARAETLGARPGGLFVVGSDVDVASIKPALEAATSLLVSAPEEPETALARGAALAAANAPLFSSSTTALAYARDPGTGFIDPNAVAPGYFDAAPQPATGEQPLAYSAVSDDEDDAYTAIAPEDDAYTEIAQEPDGATGYQYVAVGRTASVRRPFALVASAVAALFVVGVAALTIVLVGMKHTAAVQSNPGQHLVAPNKQAPAPAPAAPAPAPAPAAPAPAPEAPAPAAPAPEAPAPPAAAPAPAPAPVAPAPAPVPAAPAPAPVPAAPAPAPVPEAPVPAPAPVPDAPVAPAPIAPAPPPVAPIPVPIIVPAPQLPRIFGPPVQGPPLLPGGGDRGGGRGGFGGPGFGGGGDDGGDRGGGRGGFGGGHR